MAERGRGNSRGGNRGGQGQSSRGGGPHTSSENRPRKEAILDLSKYENQRIIVKFSGGREVQGQLKGWDQLMNLVVDGAVEMLRDDDNNTQTRNLGLLVARGTLLTSISPVDGSEEISNPFLEDEAGGAGGEDGMDGGGVVMDGP